MTPESQKNPLLEKGPLKHVSLTRNRHAIIDELFKVVISMRFATGMKGGT
jgi:hypothetical protein